ncbi:MAG: hypothetical protein Q4D87_07205 [Actinomycetaceae bacterium]|nr:hypothetical protein [Actinomycetaceae bacterium]
MTSAAVKTRPIQSTREHAQTRPQLRVIESHAGPRAVFPVLMIVALVLLSVLAVNLFFTTQMAQMAYEIRDSRAELVRLTEETQTLRQELQVASSPSALQKAASEQGMVPAGQAGFIQLSTGKVEGGFAAVR